MYDNSVSFDYSALIPARGRNPSPHSTEIKIGGTSYGHEIFVKTKLDDFADAHIQREKISFSNPWIMEFGGATGERAARNAKRDANTLNIDQGDFKIENSLRNGVLGREAIRFMQADVTELLGNGLLACPELRSRPWSLVNMRYFLDWFDEPQVKSLLWNLPAIANDNTHVAISFSPRYSHRSDTSNRRRHDCGVMLNDMREVGYKIIYTNYNGPDDPKGYEIFARVLGNAYPHP